MTADMRGCFWEKLRLAEPSGSFLVGSSHCSQYSGARNWFCLCFQKARDFPGPIHPSENHKRLLENQDAFFFFNFQRRTCLSRDPNICVCIGGHPLPEGQRIKAIQAFCLVNFESEKRMLGMGGKITLMGSKYPPTQPVQCLHLSPLYQVGFSLSLSSR